MRLRAGNWLYAVCLIGLSVGILVCPSDIIDSVSMGVVSFFSPIQRLFSRPFRSASKTGSGSSQSGPSRSQIRSLQNRILHQQEIIGQLSQQLRSLNAFRREFPDLAVHSLPAEVIGHDLSTTRRSLIVDVGLSQGVRRDCPVLVDGALAGRVVAAGRRASRVMLTVDPGSAVPVLATRTREQGIVEGNVDDKRMLILQFADRFARLRPKDVLVTSGIGGVYPKGLVVGQVVSCRAPPGALFRKVEVRPAVDFSRIERVIVLRRTAVAATRARAEQRRSGS